ncbi:hypothetical protein ON010_g5204 [Phytophthora cinnamomi]|nr:hypothetical protein ON010_g5204 [Phytophthora cinnamomi]
MRKPTYPLSQTARATPTAPHTAAYLPGEIEKFIAEIERDATAYVIAVVTDNAQNVRSASGQIQIRWPNIEGGGCSAHVLNLLMQDVCRFSAIKAVQTRAVAIARSVGDHLVLLGEFKRLEQGVRDVSFRARNLVLPVPTRWYFGNMSIFVIAIVEQQKVGRNYDIYRTWYATVAFGMALQLLTHGLYWAINSDTDFPVDDNSLLDTGEYDTVAALPLVELRKVFREKIRRCCHTNAMSIAFMLDQATDLDDFAGSDDDDVENQVCEMAKRYGNLSPEDGIAKLSTEILKFKSDKRRGSEERVKISSPQEDCADCIQDSDILEYIRPYSLQAEEPTLR